MQWHWVGAGTDWQTDRGLAYGDGLFETLRVLPSGPVLAERHRNRLLAGSRALGLPFAEEHWKCWLSELAQRGWLHTQEDAGHIVKIVVTRGSGGRGYRPPETASIRVITSIGPVPLIPAGPVALHLCRTAVAPVPGLAGYKTLNRLEQVLASRELPSGAFEGLMTDPQGRLVEGTRSNIFVLLDDLLYTPPRRQLAVAGVLRDALVEALPGIGIPVREAPIGFQRLRQSQGAFIVNSVMGVVEVGRIGCFKLGYAERTAEIRSFTRQHFGI